MESTVIFSRAILIVPLLPIILGLCVFSIFPLNTIFEGFLSYVRYSFCTDSNLTGIPSTLPLFKFCSETTINFLPFSSFTVSNSMSGSMELAPDSMFFAFSEISSCNIGRLINAVCVLSISLTLYVISSAIATVSCENKDANKSSRIIIRFMLKKTSNTLIFTLKF